MDVKIKQRDGVKLLTANTYFDEDLNIVFADNLFDTAIEDALVSGTLTTYSNDRVTTARWSVFKGTNIEYLDFPNATGTLGTTALQGSSKLKGINIPKITQVNDQAFMNCTALEKISLPSVDKISSSAFNGCVSLKSVHIGSMGPYYDIGSSIFSKCYSLKTIVITHETRVIKLGGAMTDWYHFYGTQNDTYNPEGLKDGCIYLPDSLIEDYKIATNWSVFADQMKPLSELPQEIRAELNI